MTGRSIFIDASLLALSMVRSWQPISMSGRSDRNHSHHLKRTRLTDMKQEAALSIIEEAGQHQHIAATLDTKHTGRYKHGGGYRVRLAHHRAQRVLVIDKQEQSMANRPTGM